MKKKYGFTILELSIAIIILAFLSSLVLVALGPQREANRNTKRVADIREMQLALKMFYRDWGVYPTVVVAGTPLVSGSNTYMASWPSNPTPRNDGSCPNLDYTYNLIGFSSYSITFCLSATTGDVGQGTSWAIPDQIVTCLPNCVKSCGTGSNGCGGTCSNVGSCAAGETCISDHCIKT